MKKMVLKLLLICVLFLGVSNVGAVSLKKGDIFTRTITKELGGDAVGLKYGENNLTINSYAFSSDVGVSNIPGYCFDPNVTGTTDLVVKRILGESTYNEQAKMLEGGWSYDYGMLEILRNGYRNANSSYTTYFDGRGKITTSGEELELATSIAVRAFTLGLFGYGKDSDIMSSALSSAYINEGAHWAAIYSDYSAKIYKTRFDSNPIYKTCLINAEGVSDKYEDKYEAYLACFKEMNSDYYSSKWYNQSYMFSDTTTSAYRIIYSAMGLFRDGLIAAADFVDNKVGVVSNVTARNNANEVIVDNTDSKYVTEKKIVTFTINNFPENGSVIYDGITCNGCGKLMSIEKVTASVHGNEVDITAGFDLEDLAKTNNGIVNVNIYVIKDKTSEECYSPRFRLNYTVNDPSKDIIGAILHDSTNTSETQRYIIAVDASPETKSYIEGTLRCPEEICDTIIEVPVCSDADLSNDDWLDNNDNKAGDYIASIQAPSNIQKCVLNNFDDTGNNSYLLATSNKGVSKSNPYCQIYCKEDYAAIRLNPLIGDNYQVVCGTYFQLQASIDGTKDCYTDGNASKDAIDREQFEEDLENARREMIDAWNIYSFYKAAAAIKATHDPSFDSDPGCSGGSPGCSTCDPPTPNTEWSCGSRERNGDVVTKEWTFTTYDFDGEVNYNQKSYTPLVGETLTASYKNGTEASCWCCGCSGSIGVDPDEDHISKKTTSLTTLNQKINAYNAVISEYNACTTDWVNDFLFDEIKVSFYYDEKTSNSFNDTMYYRLLTREQQRLLTPVGGDNEETEVSVCLGNINSSYECLNNERTYTIQTTSLDEYNAPIGSLFNEVFNEEKYILCSESSCGLKDFNISQARYVRKSVSNSQKYITPSVFYQIYPLGKITTNIDADDGDYLQVKLLENSLPVSTRLVGGGIFRLMIQDMGEFYSENGDEVGRLIDFNYNVVGTNREEDSVAYYHKINGTESFDGNYVCEYHTDCRPSDCPNCEFTCDYETSVCEFKDCPECNFTCSNCIFNLDRLELNFKSVSTNSFDSANRTYGYNWDINSKVSIILANKAQETIKEIEEANDTIYDESFTVDGSRTDSNLAFSIRLTPAVIQYVKDYNDEVEENATRSDADYPSGGGYANDTLTCYDYTDEDGATFENLLCYSSFIDDLVAEFNNGTNDLVVIHNRDNVEERTSNINKKGYWTLWTDHYGDTINESVIGGPAWK